MAHFINGLNNAVDLHTELDYQTNETADGGADIDGALFDASGILKPNYVSKRPIRLLV
jgi:hypothetical protein